MTISCVYLELILQSGHVPIYLFLLPLQSLDPSQVFTQVVSGQKLSLWDQEIKKLFSNHFKFIHKHSGEDLRMLFRKNIFQNPMQNDI